MTRWARNKSAQKHGKLPEDPTPWTELKANVTTTGGVKVKSTTEGVKQKRMKVSEDVVKPKAKETILTKRKRVNSFTVIPLEPGVVVASKDISPTNKVEQTKEEKPKLGQKVRDKTKLDKETKDKGKKSEKKSKILDKPEDKAQVTKEDELKRIQNKEKHRQRMIKKRNERGIQLLSPKMERKIYNIKKGMRRKGLTGEEIKQEIRKVRRNEELKLRRDNDGKLCLRCRQPGHRVADCQEITGDNQQSMGICFKCGSTEHKLSQCTVKSDKESGLPFAKCFVCGGMGHLSATCPKNPRGKYPKGGSCKICDSINHFASDCPRGKRFQEDDEPTVLTISQGVSADLEEDYLEESATNQKINKKTISF